MTLEGFDPNAASQHDGVFGLPSDAEDSRVVLIGVPFDATTSYRGGAALGPEGIRAASLQVDLHDHQVGDPWKHGIHMLPIHSGIEGLNAQAQTLAAPVKAVGGVPSDDPSAQQVNAICEQAMRNVRALCDEWLDRGKLLGIVGGDHSTPLPLMLALASRSPGIGILHIDAHADLRVAFEGFRYSHASIMHNALCMGAGIERLVQVGVRDLCEAEAQAIGDSQGRIRTWFDTDIASALFDGESYRSLASRIVECLPCNVYISFDIDGLDPCLCPNTGTPVPGGLSFNQACYLLEAIVLSGRRILGFDLCEVAPGHARDSIDTIVGARILYKLIGWMLRSLNCSPAPSC